MKILFVTGGALLLGAGSVLSYLQARPAEPLSDLTLANIEAMSVEKETPGVRIPCCPAYWFNYCIFPGTMANGVQVNVRMDGAINC